MCGKGIWSFGILGALLIIGAVIAGLRCLLAKPHDFQSNIMYAVARETDGAHALMNLGMALMLLPWYGIILTWILTAAFGTMSAIFGVLVLLAVRPDKNPSINDRTVKLGTYLYHFAAALVMVYAVQSMFGRIRLDTIAGISIPLTWVAYILGAAFLIDLVGSVVIVIWFPTMVTKVAGMAVWQGKDSGRELEINAHLCPSRARSIRLALLPHIIMDIGMVWMFSMS